MFANSIDTGNIAANISGFNCHHKSYVEDKLLSTCDASRDGNGDDETNFNCDTCLAGDESIKLDSMDTSSISLHFVDDDHTCQPFCLQKVNPSEFKAIW